MTTDDSRQAMTWHKCYNLQAKHRCALTLFGRHKQKRHGFAKHRVWGRQRPCLARPKTMFGSPKDGVSDCKKPCLATPAATGVMQACLKIVPLACRKVSLDMPNECICAPTFISFMPVHWHTAAKMPLLQTRLYNICSSNNDWWRQRF